MFLCFGSEMEMFKRLRENFAKLKLYKRIIILTALFILIGFRPSTHMLFCDAGGSIPRLEDLPAEKRSEKREIQWGFPPGGDCHKLHSYNEENNTPGSYQIYGWSWWGIQICLTCRM